jgi:hypothetical protein
VPPPLSLLAPSSPLFPTPPSHNKQPQSNTQDPLEKFCDDNPDADECRVYDD